MPITWNPEKGRYQYQGENNDRFLTLSEVMSRVSSSTTATENTIRQLAHLLSDGSISPEAWRDAMRSTIKDKFLVQYMAGYGGRDKMTYSEWGRVGRMIRDQYKYLNGFYDAVLEGDLTAEQIASRAAMYIDASQSAFNKAFDRRANQLGYDQEQWLLGFAEHCDDCLAYSAMGWQPIGTFPIPGDGTTRCIVNCKCTKQYRNTKTNETYYED
jgi:hypothetical protein